MVAQSYEQFIYIGLFVVLTTLISEHAYAQTEVICDPENPSCKVSVVDPKKEEVICDPENPSCKTSVVVKPVKPTQNGVEEVCDPENPSCKVNVQNQSPTQKKSEVQSTGLLNQESFDVAPQGVSAQFKGAYGMSMIMDTGHDHPGEDIVEWLGGLTLSIGYDVSATFRVVAEGQFRYWAAGKENLRYPDIGFNAWDKRAQYDVLLGETYALWRKNAWSLRIGNLKTPWGSTDLSRPGDVINPQDFRGLVGQYPGGFDSTLAQFGVDANYIGNKWAFQFVLIPFYIPDKTPVVGTDTAIGTLGTEAFSGRFPVAALGASVLNRLFVEQGEPLVFAPNTGPQALPQNLGLGGRLSATFWNMDMGLGYFVGWDRTPFVTMDEDARQLFSLVSQDGTVLQDGNLPAFFMRNPDAVGLTSTLQTKLNNGEQIVSAKNLRRHTFVLDFARYFGPIGVRWDTAISPQRVYFSREMESIRRPTIETALGLSYETFDDGYQLALILEGFGTKVFEQNSTLTRWFVDESQRGSRGSQALLINDGLYGLSAGINWTLTEWNITTQFGGLYNISSEDWLISARLSKRFNTYAQLSLGWMHFNGPDPAVSVTLGGLLDHQDAVFLGFDGHF